MQVDLWKAEWEGRLRRRGERVVAVAVSTTRLPPRGPVITTNFRVIDLAAVDATDPPEDVGFWQNVGWCGWDPETPSVMVHETPSAFRVRVYPGGVDFYDREVQDTLRYLQISAADLQGDTRSLLAGEALGRFGAWLGGRRLISHSRGFVSRALAASSVEGVPWERDPRWILSLSRAAQDPMGRAGAVPVLKSGEYKTPSLVEMLQFYKAFLDVTVPEGVRAFPTAWKLAALYRAMGRAGHIT